MYMYTHTHIYRRPLVSGCELIRARVTIKSLLGEKACRVLISYDMWDLSRETCRLCQIFIFDFYAIVIACLHNATKLFSLV